MKMNVWRFPCSKRYYLTHPLKWIKQVWRSCRDTYMRARYGYTYSDVWNWDIWFLATAVPMLRYLADHSSAYPGNEEFDTPEKWEQWLHHVADLLESGDKEWQDVQNEYHEDYMNELVYTPAAELFSKPSELFYKYAARAEELSDEGEANIIEAFAQIGKNFYALWD